VPHGVTLAAPPEDAPAAVRAFLDRFRPDVAVMSDGELRPALLHEAALRQLPMIMVDARSPYLVADRKGWFPGLTRSLLAEFDQVIALDEPSARAFARAGLPQTRLRAEGRMEEGSRALGCNEAERAALLRLFGTRPVWLAACLPQEEEAAVIAAHRNALRLAHRLLLVIVPEAPDRSDPLARQIAEAEGWTVARRSMEQEPDAETEVYLADAAAELGLWYRLAPITFLGGSLHGAGSLRDPYEPAALGSAILHGPHPGDWATSFARLGEARATRSVGSAGELGDAVGDLLSPDRAARMAQAAWAVSSAGAEVTDRVVMLLRELLAART
jgi:3-deoxy-D-manno-octulosonic-acid transferase